MAGNMRQESHNAKRSRLGKAVVGSGGRHRKSLRGKGPTPKAVDRVYHKAYKEKLEKESASSLTLVSLLVVVRRSM